MLLTRKRAYYLLRELECVSCRTKIATRLFIDGHKYKGDEIDVPDDSVVDAFCINCADKAQKYRQNPQRKANVNEAIRIMYLREKAKIPTRYDAYRTKTRETLTPEQVRVVLEKTTCAVCGKTDKDCVYEPWVGKEAVVGFNMWPERVGPIDVNDSFEIIDTMRDCVWLCPEHYDKAAEIKLSLDFDENFYNAMRTLYS